MLLKAPYSLAQPVAAAIAKAATLHDKLPQGAPTSPVLSNLICAKMDAELTRLAISNRCKYSRYADDITFSTTRPFMPLASVIPDAEGNPTCKLNDSLRAIIEQNGFSINEKKVRLRDATARQEVTGLIVNKRVNTKRTYVREVRALLHAWRKFGLVAAAAAHTNNYGGKTDFESVVRGRIEFIGHIRGRPDPLFRKLADQFNALVKGGTIRTVLTADEIARAATWVIESDEEQGTAFFLEPFGLITCSHCVGSNPRIWHPNFPTKKYKVALLKEDKHRDLAILETPKDLNVQKLKLHTSVSLKDGSDIALLGYPNHSPGHNIRVEQGKIVRSVTRSLVNHYEISPKIIGGNSGGPVIASNNDVVGIAVRGLSGSVTLSTAEFFAINANELRLWLT